MRIVLVGFAQPPIVTRCRPVEIPAYTPVAPVEGCFTSRIENHYEIGDNLLEAIKIIAPLAEIAGKVSPPALPPDKTAEPATTKAAEPKPDEAKPAAKPADKPTQPAAAKPEQEEGKEQAAKKIVQPKKGSARKRMETLAGFAENSQDQGGIS